MNLSVAQLSGMQSARAVLNCLMWPVWLHRIFPFYFKRNEYRGKVIYNWMFVLFLCTILLKNIPHNTTNSSRYYHKCISVFIQSSSYSCLILKNHGFSRHISENILITFHENLYSGSRIVPRRWTDGQRDRHDLTNSRFSKILWTRLKTGH